MRLIEKLLGREKAAQAEAVSRSGSDILPRESVFSGSPPRILRTGADVKKDDALLEMSVVVAEIEKDPDTNWQRHKGDFEKAVVGMREAFEPTRSHEAAEAPSKNTLQQELMDSGWKLSSRDQVALSAYEQNRREDSRAPNAKDAAAWIKDWRGLDEEERKDRVEAQHQSDRDYGVDR